MHRFYNGFLRIEAMLAGIFLLLMVVSIFVGGTARLARMPLNWTIDLATCSFAWAAFLCADIAWRKDLLMSVDGLVVRLPAKLRHGVALLNFALIGCFLIYLIYSGINLAWVSRARSFQGIPGVSYSWVTASLPVGAALMLMTTVIKVRGHLQRTRIEAASRQEASRPC